MREEIWRYVVLHHTGGPLGEHFDLMMEVPGEEGLRTWRIVEEPGRWGLGVRAERIGEHRREYLTYEGEVSGGRGWVKRVAEGSARVVRREGGGWRVRLEGGVGCEVELPE